MEAERLEHRLRINGQRLKLVVGAFGKDELDELDLLELVTRMNFYGTVHSCSAVAPAMKAIRTCPSASR